MLFGRQIINRYWHITFSHKCHKRFKSISILMLHWVMESCWIMGRALSSEKLLISVTIVPSYTM